MELPALAGVLLNCRARQISRWQTLPPHALLSRLVAVSLRVQKIGAICSGSAGRGRRVVLGGLAGSRFPHRVREAANPRTKAHRLVLASLLKRREFVMSNRHETEAISRRKLFLILAAGSLAMSAAVLAASSVEAQQPQAQQPVSEPPKKKKKKKKKAGAAPAPASEAPKAQ